MDDLTLEEMQAIHALVGRCLSLSIADANALLEQSLRDRRPSFIAEAKRLYQASSLIVRSHARGALPDRTPEYEVVRQLGRGGTSEVYLARQLHLNRQVALKVLRSSDIASSDETWQRFAREVEAAAKLDHPNIVAVYETGRFRDQPCIAYRFVDGQTLAQACLGRPMSPDAAARCVLGIAKGIAHAHQRQVVHRDLKPANVMLENGNPVIADFGLALVLDVSSEITRTGEVLGTLNWMSPEQARGERSQVGPSTDIYSLGNLLYFALAGRAPFESPTLTKFLQDVQTQSPPRLPKAIPSALVTICETCLMKSIGDRYASAQMVAEELQRYLDRKPIAAKKIGRLKRLRLWAQRERGLAASLFVISLLVGALILGSAGAAMFYAEKATTETGLRLQESNQRRRADHQRLHAEALREQSRARELSARAAALDIRDDLSADLGAEPFEVRLIARQFPQQVEYSRVLEDGRWAFVDALLDSDRQRAVSLDEGRRLQLWDTKAGRVLRMLDSGTPGELGVESKHTFTEWADLPATKAPHVWSDLDWSPDRQKVVASSLAGPVVEFALHDGAQRELLNLPTESWHTLSVDAKTGQFLVGSESGLLLLRRGEKDHHQVKGTSAVTCLASIPELQSWVVGRADGQVEVRDGESLKLLHVITLPGPIWSVDTKTTPDRTGLIAIGANSLTAQVYELSPQRDRLQWRASLQRTGTQDATGFVSCVRFTPNGNGLFVGDSEWRVSRWEWAKQRSEWILPKLAKDDRRPILLKRLLTARPDLQDHIPLAFRRSVVQVAEDSDGRVMIGGEDGVLKWCRADGSQQPLQRRWNAPEFERPQVAFHRQDSDALWLLSATGMLGTFSINQGAITRKVEAHLGSMVGIVTLKDGSVLTVGHDAEVRQWRIQNDQIERVGDAVFRHAVPIVSIAVSPDESLVAFVDIESRVCVFERLTGKSVLLMPIPGAERQPPLTGKIAFSPDGKRLAASGAGQVVCVLDVVSFRVEGSSMTVAGDGATALAWCGSRSGLLFAADDAKRYAFQTFDELPRYRSDIRPPLDVKQNCVAMAQTPDGRRVACLEAGGAVNFVETNWLLEVHRQQTDVGREAIDIAFDLRGNRCVVTGRDGEIFLWDVSQSPPSADEPVEISDVTEAWTATEVIPPTDNLQPIFMKAVSQHEGRLAIAAVIGHAESRHDLGHGQLHVLTETDKGWQRDAIVVDGTKRDFAAQPDSVGIERLSQAQVRLAFRRNLGPDGPYDGDFMLGERDLDQRWHFETIARQTNSGHYPTLLTNPDGSLQAVANYSFAYRELLLSLPPDKPGATWHDIKLTGPGLGLRAQGWLNAGNESYLFMQRHRINGDPSWPRLLEVRNESATRIELPPDCELMAPIRRTQHAQPLILVRQFINSGRRSELVFMQRDESEWKRLASMPISTQFFGWQATKSGHIVVLLRSASDPELKLATWNGKQWKHEIIYRRPNDEAFGYTVMLIDEHDRLSILLQNSVSSSADNRSVVRLVRNRLPRN